MFLSDKILISWQINKETLILLEGSKVQKFYRHYRIIPWIKPWSEISETFNYSIVFYMYFKFIDAKVALDEMVCYSIILKSSQQSMNLTDKFLSGTVHLGGIYRSYLSSTAISSNEPILFLFISKQFCQLLTELFCLNGSRLFLTSYAFLVKLFLSFIKPSIFWNLNQLKINLKK